MIKVVIFALIKNKEKTTIIAFSKHKHHFETFQIREAQLFLFFCALSVFITVSIFYDCVDENSIPRFWKWKIVIAQNAETLAV
jgi:hypothetical protein